MPTGILIYTGLASTMVVALIEFHTYVSLTTGVVPAITIIALAIVASYATFKQPIGQVLSGYLLSLSIRK